jgi:acetolactate synthase-1/2/3 large subunit
LELKQTEKPKRKIILKGENGAQIFLETLKLMGVRYFFANTGTDYPAFIDAMAKYAAEGEEYPKLILCPHETVAVAMAHGFYMISHEPQLVMVHTIPGTANALAGLMNAKRQYVPLILLAGRTPVTEEGSKASRDFWIHWAQESRDQGALVREFVKWDYEIRVAEQAADVAQRSWKVAMTDPKGPVYVSFPREWTMQPVRGAEVYSPDRQQPPVSRVVDDSVLDSVAEQLISAERPLITTKRLGQDPGAVRELVRLAELLAIPVLGALDECFNFPNTHPLAVSRSIQDADTLFVIESDEPWAPMHRKPQPDAKVISLQTDAALTDYPLWSFHADLAMSGEPKLILSKIVEKAKAKLTSKRKQDLKGRYDIIAAMHEEQKKNAINTAQSKASDLPIDFAWLSYNIGLVKRVSDIVVNEYSLDPNVMDFPEPGTYFSSPTTGSLGWGLGAALGAKLAAPDRTVIAALGDGSYIFGVPTAGHFVSESYKIPFLTIIYNNQCWGSTKRSLLAKYADGWAVKTGHFIGTDLKPAPRFKYVAMASGAYAETVEDPKEVRPALERALNVVRKEGNQALLDVVCKYPPP